MREKKEKKPQRFQEVSTEGSALSENGCKTVIVDTETGVHYLHIKCGYSGSITPLYNADGTLVVTKYGRILSKLRRNTDVFQGDLAGLCREDSVLMRGKGFLEVP